jgi:hypothetical protein
MLHFFLAALIAASAPAISWAASVSANLAVTVTSSASGTIQATNFCAANGGGDGSAGNPWHDTCIQAAINAASNGDTVSLAAGNWAFSYSNPAVITAKGINLVGAGSGNTFDAYGHPNNPMWNKTGTYTRIYQSSGCSQAANNCQTTQNGFLHFESCTAAPSVSHLFVDGSVNTAGGDVMALLSFRFCPNVNVNDIRVWANGQPDLQSGETQFNIADQIGPSPVFNAVVQNSIFAEPPVIVGGLYPSAQIFQNSSFDGFLVKNNIFYMSTANIFFVDNLNYTTNLTVDGCDALGCSNQPIPSFGFSGCTKAGCYNSSNTGQYHMFTRNSVFSVGTTAGFGIGGGVNDPGGSGIINDLQWTGNWINGVTVALDSCAWRIFGYCTPGQTTGVVGNQVNGFGYNFNVQNNTLIGTSSAQLNAATQGCNSSGLGASCGSGLTDATTVNFDASQNYLSSPSNQYNHDADAITPNVSGNFCSGTGTFTGCTTTGFTNAPTASFTLGALSGGVVPFNTTTFTAQYGAVKWLASTSSATPTSGDARWNFLPPVSLAAASGNTVYMWTMDSANHISAPASVAVP